MTSTVSPAIETVKSVKIVRIGKLMENVKSFRMIGSVTNLLSKSAKYRISDGEDHGGPLYRFLYPGTALNLRFSWSVFRVCKVGPWNYFCLSLLTRLLYLGIHCLLVRA